MPRDLPQDAEILVGLAEEEVQQLRQRARTDPPSLRSMAVALHTLGVRYSWAGRPQEAVTPTEEAARLFRQVAAKDPASAPELAMALTHLGIRYGEVGRRARQGAAANRLPDARNQRYQAIIQFVGRMPHRASKALN